MTFILILLQTLSTAPKQPVYGQEGQVLLGRKESKEHRVFRAFREYKVILVV